jgi:hypothetical protein
MRFHAAVTVVFFAGLSLVATAVTWHRTVADSACVTQPAWGAPPGEHWYYHVDRAKNRKCWHRGPVGTVTYEPPPYRTERAPTVGSTLNAMFAPLFRGIRNAFREPMHHEAAAGEPHIVQSDATQPLTIEDIAQPQPDIPEEHAEETRPLAPFLTSRQRRALFDVYMKWEAQQHAVGRSAAPARLP